MSPTSATNERKRSYEVLEKSVTCTRDDFDAHAMKITSECITWVCITGKIHMVKNYTKEHCRNGGHQEMNKRLRNRYVFRGPFPSTAA